MIFHDFPLLGLLGIFNMLQPQQLQLWVHIDLGSILMESRGEERLLYKEGVSQRWENSHEDYRKHNKKEERIMTICAVLNRLYVLLQFSCTHTSIQKYTSSHDVYLQTSLSHNCSDIYICT